MGARAEMHVDASGDIVVRLTTNRTTAAVTLTLLELIGLAHAANDYAGKVLGTALPPLPRAPPRNASP